MNVLIGAVSGMGGSTITKESLSVGAKKMRKIATENSKIFPGITDGTTVLSNSSGISEGVLGDNKKDGGNRLVLDVLCGTDNARCKTNKDGSLQLTDKGMVQFDPEKADGKSLAQFMKTDEGKKLVAIFGGVQGGQGTLFGLPYLPGSWQDNLVEAFAGTHDFIGGQLIGTYDAQGNIKRGQSSAEKIAREMWSGIALVPSAPFAMTELLPAQVWQAILIFLAAAK